ncbi:MAG: 2-oxoglutarate oxidoreductase [Firmicutes bacterium]|jgi:2-oxoglutarate ferredoxin oxidoreductase subunit beta|nr:2-oxoglutarate oxidoreductase [Bacillota bacterium]
MTPITEKKIFGKPSCLLPNPFHFCPGCHHGVIHRLIAEAIDFHNIASRTIGVVGVGCGVFLYDYIAVDCCEASHGRAPATATGIKRVLPDRIVFTYQGDGDLAAIGTSEIIHTANRGENITVFFINNSVYGMTGGQMAPTTLPGQKTTTTPRGRKPVGDGFPMKISEMVSLLEGTAYVERVACHTPAHVRKARKAVFRAFEMQMQGKGFSMVEFVSACPTNWRLSPVEAAERIEQQSLKEYPLGVFKEPTGDR